MSQGTVTTWTCDGCGDSVESTTTYPPRGDWGKVTLRRQVSENAQEVHAMLLCVPCQGRMLDALKVQATR